MSTFTSLSATYRVAAIQYEPTLGDKEKNLSALLALVEDAASRGARLIVLPEMATTGSCWTSREEIAADTESIPGPTTHRFQRLATAYSCYIVVGLPECDPELQVFYNSAVLIGPEGIVGTYRKIHSSVIDPRWARDGDLGVLTWETSLGRIGIMIGTDTLYFETARLAALQGADVLVLLTNCSNEKCPSCCWMARAFENGVYLVAANRYGRERKIQFSGGSCVVNPDGTLQNYRDDGQGIVFGEVTLPQSRERVWQFHGQVEGYPLADRHPGEYLPLLSNNYLWEPLRYHSLYTLSQLPPGQLSCVGTVQMALTPVTARSSDERIQSLHHLLETSLRDNTPAIPDVVVLPELLLPGPVPIGTDPTPVEIGTSPPPVALSAEIRQYFHKGAIRVPGPETAALVDVAAQLQISMVLGVAERFEDHYYSTILLLDPEGIYGIYRKIHLSPRDRLWAEPGDCGFPVFDLPAGRIGLSTGYDLLFPETVRILAGKGADLICAPAALSFPAPAGLPPSRIPRSHIFSSDEYDPLHSLIWRVRAAEHNVYLSVANWYGEYNTFRSSGLSGIFSPSLSTYPRPEVVAEDDETGLMMMTIDTREQRTGRRTSEILDFSPGTMAGSLTGELAYNVFDTIPGNTVRSKPLLRKRQPFWYKDLVRGEFQT